MGRLKKGNARLTIEHFGQIEKGGKSCEHKIQNVFLKYVISDIK